MIHPSSAFAKAMADRPCILSPRCGEGRVCPPACPSRCIGTKEEALATAGALT